MLFLVFPGVYSPLYFVSVLSVLSFVSLCGHRSPVFCSPHSLIPFTCPQLVSPPPTPYMDFLPVLCPSCFPLLPRYPSVSFYLNPSVSVMVASSSFQLCVCTCPIFPTPGSSLRCLFCVISVSVFFFFFYTPVCLDSDFWIFPLALSLC